MDARHYFLTRRHRVGILIGNAVGLLVVGIELGMVFTNLTLRPEWRINRLSLGLGLMFLGVLFTTFVRRIRWLDSAVAQPAPEVVGSEPAA